jgi:hypothetical protein
MERTGIMTEMDETEVYDGTRFVKILDPWSHPEGLPVRIRCIANNDINTDLYRNHKLMKVVFDKSFQLKMKSITTVYTGEINRDIELFMRIPANIEYSITNKTIEMKKNPIFPFIDTELNYREEDLWMFRSGLHHILITTFIGVKNE